MKIKWMMAVGCLAFSMAAAAEGDVVNLEYDWKPGMEAQVTYTLDQYRVGGGGDDTNVTGSYVLRTRQAEGGLLVEFSDSKVSVESANSELGEKMQHLMERLAAFMPAYLINTQGELERIVGFDEMYREMRARVDSWVSEVPDETKAMMNHMTEHALSEQNVMAQAVQSWNRDVAQWVGAELEAGYVYSVEFESYSPMVPNIPILTVGEYEYLGKVACNEADTGNQCVKLRYSSSYDPESALAAVRQTLESMGIPVSEDFTVSMDYVVEIVTGEENLIPHHIREVKVTGYPSQETGDFIQNAEVTEIFYRQ